MLILLVLPLVSAEIFVGPLNGIYNLDDEILTDISVIPGVSTSDHLLVDIVCGNVVSNIFNQYINIAGGEQRNIDAITKMNKLYLPKMLVNVANNPAIVNLSNNSSGQSNNNSSGYHTEIVTIYENCYLSIKYGLENLNTGSFEISKDIEVYVNWETRDFNPGDVAKISGSAEKESGELFNGFIEISVPSLSVYKTGVVNNGVIDHEFIIPAKAKSGKHIIIVRVYQTSNTGDIINEGYFEEELKVNQIMKSLEIKVNEIKSTPGNEFLYKVNSYDQAKDIINSEISVIIFDPKNFVKLKKLIKPDTEQKISFELNSTPGYWKIEASSGDFIGRKIFYLEDARMIQTSLINNTLIVANIGNVEYKGPLEITIGSSVEIKNLKLNVGEIQKFKLKAPDGTYSISVNDGTESSNLGNALLTGNAIKVVDVSEGLKGVIGNPIFWWASLVLFILIIVLVNVKRRLIKNKQKIESGKGKPVIENPLETNNIMNGVKEPAYSIALKYNGIKDSKLINESINKALILAKKSGAKIYVESDFKIILLCKKLTKVDNNEITIVKVAKIIENILLEHNKKYRDKISFGIGVNDGEIISEINNGKFKFTSVGGIISGAKRIAINLKNKVILSETMHRKVSGSVKTEKTKDGWEINKIRDRSQHQSFLKKFGGKN
jgi:hypothetical protein